MRQTLMRPLTTAMLVHNIALVVKVVIDVWMLKLIWNLPITDKVFVQESDTYARKR